MSFEIDQNKLASPPLKSDQEAITSFWGSYKWPFKTYNRYTQLEGLEQTADETRSMARALRFITQATELGLSIDGGLGWLSGPDVNQRVVQRSEKMSVFGESKFVAEPPLREMRAAQTAANRFESRPSPYATFERMLQEAAGRGENLEPSPRLLLESEELPLLPDSTATPTHPNLFTQPLHGENHLHPAHIEHVYTSWRRMRRRGAAGSYTFNSAAVTTEDNELTPLSDDEDNDDAGTGIAALFVRSADEKAGKSKESSSFKPNDLTTAQREMLLEMEWAQNAFMQSWVIAVVDNRSTFSNIETLTIARLPRRHLSILRRSDFWNALPGLKKVSLAVIPDWRDVKKDETTWVQDNKIPPSQSVSIAFQILHEQISSRKSITSLHFEWIGGGEYAPGLFARNQHVMPAPVVAQASFMVNRAHYHAILALPYIEHLSFKNCWFSPHIMARFLFPLKQSALQSITFDSVSLTAGVPQHAQPNAITQLGMIQNAVNIAGHMPFNNAGPPHGPVIGAIGLGFGMPPQNAPQNGAQNAVNPAPATNPPDWLQTPRSGSWLEIIDYLSPGRTLAEARSERNLDLEPPFRTPMKVSKLKFTSCGYVRLPLDFDQNAIDGPHQANNQSASTVKRMNDIESVMMKPLDPYLGVIVNNVPFAETLAIDNLWNFQWGWKMSRPGLWQDAVLDGVADPGKLRFSGIIEAAAAPSSNRQ